ncbi:MAG: LegC family aminotransferase [Rhodospirillales bacterium]|nr:LegC family aminotransferase [Rhodospirillales bacterium]
MPLLDGNEKAYLKECLDTNWVSSAGPFIEKFEAALAAETGLAHAAATVNGTAALHLALLVAGVEPEDEVLVSDLTFIAPANAVTYVGAEPVFVDADPHSWQMDTDLVAKFLRDVCDRRDGGLVNRATGRRVTAILPVHILGHPVDMDPLMTLADEFGLAVIEDATESLGATNRGKPVGSSGDISCYSFNGNKLLTSGGGGMIASDNADWIEQSRHLSTQARSSSEEYIHDAVGFNYRLTNIQAALGLAQMERIADHIAAKKAIAAAYQKAFAEVPGLSFMPEADGVESTFWLSTVLVDKAAFGMGSRDLQAHLAELSIQTRPLWQPLHLSPPYAGSMFLGSGVADGLYVSALSLPSSCGLTRDQQERVIAEVIAAQQSGPRR